MARAETPAAAPRHALGPARLAWMLLYGVLLCWPMLVTTAPLAFSDTIEYWRIGGKIARSLLPSDGGSGVAGVRAVDTEPGVRALRSIGYSFFVYLGALSPLGLALVPLLQTWLVGIAALFCLPARSPDPWRAVVSALALATLTTLPWFASYASPDMFAAAILLYFIVMLRGVDELGVLARLLLLGLASFAVLAHYGHQPLAAGLAAAILLWRLLQKRLTLAAIVFCLTPVLLPMAFNFGSSAATLNEASIAPKRLPILLARSIEDGPAAWYLRDACGADLYAVCDLFDEIPTNITEVLWRDTGLAGATPAQMDAIRAEESDILIAAFRAYPVAQLRSLFGNAALQIVKVGTGQLYPVPEVPPGGTLARVRIDNQAGADYPALAIGDLVTPVATGLSLLVLLGLLVRGRLTRPPREAFAVIVIGLLINAAIFGGLSAPVDRYQSRLAWLLPALLAAVWSFGPAARDPGR